MHNTNLTFGSVCSGIEAASVAWHVYGWKAAWFAEVDRAASEVLSHRFPHIPNHGDLSLLAGMVRRREIPAPDILVGGTPCQSFSVAGRRQGLADPRGNLVVAYIDLADAIDAIRAEDGKEPCIVVFENVPGLLTSKDNAFGCFLAGLAGDDDPVEPGPRPEPARSSAYWTWDKKAGVHRAKWPNAGAVAGPQRSAAWRTLDAQYLGLAQRRRRVFVVASARHGFDPAVVLLEFDGVRRDSAPSREAGEDIARTAGAGVAGSGGNGADGRLRQSVVEPVPTWWDGRDVSQTLDAVLHKGQTMPEKNRFPAVPQPVAYAFQLRIARNGRGDMGDVVNALTAQAGETGKGDAAPCVAYAIQERAVCENPDAGPQGKGWSDEGIAYTLEARHHVQAVAVLPFDTTQVTSPSNYSRPDYGDPCHPLASGAHPPAVCVTGDITHTLKAEGFDGSEDGTGRGQPIVTAEAYRVPGNVTPYSTGDRIDALTSANDSSAQHVIRTEMAVRRLMPVECERLQGFPDGWTLVPIGPKGKPAADGPRYKQLGNSMAVNVMRWIGGRIVAELARQQSLIGHNGGPAFGDDDFESLL